MIDHSPAAAADRRHELLTAGRRALGGLTIAGAILGSILIGAGFEQDARRAQAAEVQAEAELRTACAVLAQDPGPACLQQVRILQATRNRVEAFAGVGSAVTGEPIAPPDPSAARITPDVQVVPTRDLARVRLCQRELRDLVRGRRRDTPSCDD